MEKKQGFFSAVWEEVARGLSPGRTRSESPGRNASAAVRLLLSRRWKGLHRQQAVADLAVPRSGSLRPVGEALAPLMEGPDPGAGDGGDPRKEGGGGWGQWVKGQLSRAPSVSSSATASSSCRRSDLRLRSASWAPPLAPIHVCSTDPLPHLSIKEEERRRRGNGAGGEN